MLCVCHAGHLNNMQSALVWTCSEAVVVSRLK